MDKETLARMFGDIFTTCTALSEEDLAQYVELEMAGHEVNRQLPEVKAHLDECSDCAARYAELTELLQAEASGKVPSVVPRHAFDLRFLTQADPEERTSGLDLWQMLRQAKEIVEAVLLPPPRPQAVPVMARTRRAMPEGVRGSRPTLQRFRAEGAALDVHVGVLQGHSRSVRTVMGRLVPHDETAQLPPGIKVLLKRGEEVRVALTEAEGVFTFEEVEPGEYSIWLEWNEQAVVVRGAEVP